MKQKQRYVIFIMLSAFFIVLGIHYIQEESELTRLHEGTVKKDAFRSQQISKQMLNYIQTTKDSGEDLGLYWLETKFGVLDFPFSYEKSSFTELKKRWHKNPHWDYYKDICEAIWSDVKYFPVPESQDDKTNEVSFVDSWMFARNYGGKRGHEGTDIMASKNERGLYPIVSMTDGVIVSKGWLEKGGYRLGIQAPSGGYFYYAHLDSYADIREGDTVKAGDLLGYMGDTGYSKIEGTTGNFPVHLHLGIYIYPGGQEVSVNPYWVLRYIENKKLKCVYS